MHEISLIIPSTQDILSNGYPKNDSGETYGPDIKGWDCNPDLILVENESGKIGYIRATEMETNASKDPAEIYTNNHKIHELNMYLQDGKTVIGKFNIE